MTQKQTHNVKLEADVSNYWVETPKHGVPFDALLVSSYWAHVSSKFKPWDEIRVCAEDGSYVGRLLVRDAGTGYANVTKLWHLDLDKVDVKEAGPIPAGYEVRFQGPISKWAVVRTTDGTVLRDKMLKAEANLWLQNHLRASAA